MVLRTVTGTVELDRNDVGIVDGHGHLWIDPPPGVAESARIELDDETMIRAELTDFYEAGGRVVVDCQPGGCGRNHRMLVELSAASRVQVTATTGFHLARYYPPRHWLWSASAAEALAYFVEELTRGMRDDDHHAAPSLREPVRATCIKVGYDGELFGQALVLTEAALQAARQTGATILVHTEQGRNVEALLAFSERRGIPPTQLYLCHMDKRPDAALHQELAETGILLGYDTFARPKYSPETGAWKLIEALAERDLDSRIAIGLDLAHPPLWRHAGGAEGLLMIANRIMPRLQAMGFSQSAVLGMTGRNVAERLAKGG